MRRWILSAGGVLALAAALAVGPFGAAAAGPYVYGCTPAAYYNTGTSYIVGLMIYNGSASTANVTHKILAGTGQVLNDPGNVSGTGFFTIAALSTLPATHTSSRRFMTRFGRPNEGDATVAASVRIVSNVPVSATLTHELAPDILVPCTPQQP